MRSSQQLSHLLFLGGEGMKGFINGPVGAAVVLSGAIGGGFTVAITET